MEIGKTVVLSEQRLVYYKLHPNQGKYPGVVIEMPNLPNDVYHRDLWYAKGYKQDAQDLMPGKPLKWDETIGSYKFNITAKEATMQSQKVVCSVCNQECVGEFGLNSHMKKHEKEVRLKAQSLKV